MQDKTYQNISVTFSLAKIKNINISLPTVLNEHVLLFHVINVTLITLTGPLNASVKQLTLFIHYH